MTLTSEVFASEARSASYVDDLSGLPRVGSYADSRSKLPAYYESPLLEDRVQVLVESPRYYSAMDGIAYGDTLNYALASTMGSFVTLDAARNADALYSWPESPLGSPVGYNTVVPVYSSIASSVVLEQHVEHLHMELEIAREDAKEDVLRVARNAARGLVAEAPLRKENEQLRTERNKLENSLEQAVASFAQEREKLVAEKQTQLDEFSIERSQRRASLDRASLEIENSIASAKAHAKAEVEVLHAQLATLVTNQQKLVDDNLSLQEMGRSREQAISSLKSMLEEERSRMRLLQTEFQALKVSSVQPVEKIVQVPQVQTIEKIVTDEAFLNELKQQLEQERQNKRLLQAEFDQFRIESEAKVAKIKLQVSSSMEELQQRSFQLIHDHERVNKELSESRSRDTERELIITNLKQSIDFKEKRLQQLQNDLEDRDLLSRELSESKSKDAEREMTIANLKQSMDFKEQRLQQLQSDLSESKSKDAEREMTIANLKQSVDFKEQRLQQLQSDLESARIERDVRMRSESLLQGVESQQIEKLRQQLDDMSIQRDQLNKEVLSLQSVQMRLEREIEGLRASLEEERLKSNAMTQLKDEHARLKMELFEWKGKDVEREMAMASLKQTADFKDRQIERLNGDLETVRIERDAGIQKGSLRLEQESEQVDKLRKQLEAASIQREELSQKVLSSERTIFSLRADVEAEQGRAKTLQKEVEAVRTESLDSARGSTEELLSARRKLQEALDENEDLNAALQRSDQELIQLRSEKQVAQRPSKVDTTADGGLKSVKLERDVEDLIMHVGVAQQRLTSNASKVTSLSFNDLRDVFDIQLRSIQELQAELQAVKAERDAVAVASNQKRKSVEEVVEVRRLLTVAETERETLRAELKALKDKQARSSITDVVGLRKQVSALESENSQLRVERQSLVDRADQAKRQSLGETLALRQRLSVAEAEVQQARSSEAMTSLRRRVDFEAVTTTTETIVQGEESAQLDVDLTMDEDDEEYDVDLTEDGVVKESIHHREGRNSSWMEQGTVVEETVTFMETPPVRRSDAQDILSGSPVERKKLSMSSRGSGK